ncbi:MAG: FadR/GntR family transcriptional regulator [Oscillospiraceae bacterium]
MGQTARRKPSLSMTVQNELQELLMNGTFKVGEYLPSEQALSERFEVSRTTIRDAISALAEKGFVERHHGKGIYVIDKSQSVAAHSLRTLMLRGHYTVAEFIETRNIIETQIAYFAATRATEEQIKTLEGCTENMLSDTDNIKAYADNDVAFHMELARASQNMLLLSVVTAIRPMLERLVQQVVEANGRTEKDSAFHARIIEAIKRRDPELSRERMEEHLRASEEMFKNSTDKDVSELWL